MKLVALIFTALVACGYSADLGDCTILCATAGCPQGLTCGAEGLCRAEDSPVCVVPSDGLGGTITHVGGRTIHTFSMAESGSTFFPPADLSAVELLVVAGGGGGGSTRGGGGGGAGGLLYTLSFAITQPGYVVLMGYGGGPATSGGDSSFGPVVAIGGGAGRPCSAPNGGSGGGVDHDANHGGPGAGTIGQGNAGGSGGYNSGTIFTGAGGGGAGGAGSNGASGGGGAGGPGLALSISGDQVYYAGGGGGAGNLSDLAPGVGGIGGGGDGGRDAIGKDGTDGTGGGGGAGGGGPDPNFFRGGRGGNGVVIVGYPTQR